MIISGSTHGAQRAGVVGLRTCSNQLRSIVNEVEWGGCLGNIYQVDSDYLTCTPLLADNHTSRIITLES